MTDSELEKRLLTLIDGERRVNEAFRTASEAAIRTAHSAMEKRLDTMNEFRGAMQDMSSRMLPRQEFVLSHDALVKSVDELRKHSIPRPEYEAAHTSLVKLTDEIRLLIERHIARDEAAKRIAAIVFSVFVGLASAAATLLVRWTEH